MGVDGLRSGAMSKKIVFITGAGRGLGHEFCTQYLEAGCRVFAGMRTVKSSQVAALTEKYPQDYIPIPFDALDSKSIDQARETMRTHVDHVDIFVNNAGRFGSSGTIDSAPDLADISLTFQTNVVGPLYASHCFLPMLRKGKEKKLIMITSLMGSIQDNESGGYYGYRISKTAVNMVVKNIAIETKKDSIVAVALHPGWVKTDMGGPNAPLTPQESVKGMASVIAGLTMDQSGSFLDYRGKKLPF